MGGAPPGEEEGRKTRHSTLQEEATEFKGPEMGKGMSERREQAGSRGEREQGLGGCQEPCSKGRARQGARQG